MVECPHPLQVRVELRAIALNATAGEDKVSVPDEGDLNGQRDELVSSVQAASKHWSDAAHVKPLPKRDSPSTKQTSPAAHKHPKEAKGAASARTQADQASSSSGPQVSTASVSDKGAGQAKQHTGSGSNTMMMIDLTPCEVEVHVSAIDCVEWSEPPPVAAPRPRRKTGSTTATRK